jgi:hypothetical protein
MRIPARPRPLPPSVGEGWDGGDRQSVAPPHLYPPPRWGEAGEEDQSKAKT